MTAFNLLIRICRFGPEVGGFKLLVVCFGYAFLRDRSIDLLKQPLTQMIDKQASYFQQLFIRDIPVKHPKKRYLNLI